MKTDTTPGIITVTLIVMGALLLSLPAVVEMVVAAQESYLLATNSRLELPPHEIDGVPLYTSLIAGIALVSTGMKLAPAHAPNTKPA